MDPSFGEAGQRKVTRSERDDASLSLLQDVCCFLWSERDLQGLLGSEFVTSRAAQGPPVWSPHTSFIFGLDCIFFFFFFFLVLFCFICFETTPRGAQD